MSERVTLPDFDAVLDAVEALRHAATTSALARLASMQLMALTTCDSVSINWMTSNHMYVSAYPTRTTHQLSLEPILATHWQSNPLAQELRTSGRVTPVAWSDVERDGCWRKGPLFVDFYAPLGVNDQLVMQLPTWAGVMGVLAVNYSGPIRPSDRLVLATVGAHLSLGFHAIRHRELATAGQWGPTPDAQLTREAWQLVHGGPTLAMTDDSVARHRCAVPGLSFRETEVAILVADGRSNQQIANRLGISVGTVKKHCQRIFQALGVDNRAAAAVSVVRLRG